MDVDWNGKLLFINVGPETAKDMHHKTTRSIFRRLTQGFYLLTPLILAIGFLVLPVAAQEAESGTLIITGSVLDSQGQAVPETEISLKVGEAIEPYATTESLEDGTWVLHLESLPPGKLKLEVSRAHFESAVIELEPEYAEALVENGSGYLTPIVLERRISAGFWAATVIFVLVLLAIAFEKLHTTTAALAGLSALMLITGVGGVLNPDLFIFDFEQALTFINWEVIFLVMAMMIIIAIIERTGIFQWTAFQAYRLSRGRAWVLVLILMGITAVASALLDNFTTMLLMTPISLQIGLALGINPLALIIPEVLASNVGGITTLIGTPTNILIGAYADIGFSGFLVNQTAGVVLGLLLMGGYVLFHYREEWKKQSGGVSEILYAKLEENAKISDPNALLRSGIVFVLVLIGFLLGEGLHIPPAVPALIGATILLLWLRPDVHSSITAVDWTTLVFFMALFIVVGAIQEVGLISIVASAMGQLIGDNLVLGIFVIVFGVGTLSVAIANIPLAASMLPVVEFLSGSVPGGSSQVLYYALSMGAAMGGNGFLIGAEANLVTAGITQQAGSKISFSEFLRIGLPVTYLTLTVGFLWLVLRFILIGSG
jgi:Na+/H+ antiporter NhaD/arsenite permease-like protein